MTQPHDPRHDPHDQGPQPQQGPPPGQGPYAAGPPGPPPGPPGPPGPPLGGPPGYGPAPQQPGHGPPPGHGPYPGYPPQPGAYPPPAKKSSAGLVIGLVAGALVLVLVIAGGGLWLYASSRTAPPSGAASGGDVLTFEGLSADHVEVGETVEYDVFPPAGGPHYPTWQDCGVYTEPLRAEFAVHSLEHGAVWITYDASLSPDEVAVLEGLYTSGDYLLVSPMDGLPSRVVASAWGSQLRLEDPADPALAGYLREYVQGPATPEPGAPCSGGVSESGEAAEALATTGTAA